MPDKIQKLMAEAEEISAAPTSPVSALLYVLCLPLCRSALHSSFKVICDIWLPCSGAAQSALLCFLLFQLSDTIDSSFAAKQAPTQFVARNITLTVQEIVRAVSYLFTFICGMNCLGMTGMLRRRV